MTTGTPAVTRLTLTDFRSHAAATIAAAAGLVVVTGENGQGKTNVLDALSLLAPGRGLRGAPLAEAARHEGAGGWSVAARITAAGGDIEIGTGTLPSQPDRRQVRINGASATATAITEWLSVLWLTPAMDRLFSEPPSGRRRFLDRLVLALHPGHGRAVTRYDAAMRQRTRLLLEDAPDPAWLGALEAAMADHGAAIAHARSETVAALGEVLASSPEGPFARAALHIDGWQGDGDFAGALARHRRSDAAAGRATAGPHRSDFGVTHAAKRVPAGQSSTGEQKALLLGIILAHRNLVADRTGAPPLLLLDEVAAHLDARRRAALFEQLLDGGGQVWMTGTEPALFTEAAAATRIAIEGGRPRQV
jgi:DNA replication and repair protein RecF